MRTKMLALAAAVITLWAVLIGSLWADEAHGAEPVTWAPPCVYENGSGVSGYAAGRDRCVWRADQRGNKAGRSVLYYNSGQNWHIKYVSHKRAKRLIREWRRLACEKTGVKQWSCH